MKQCSRCKESKPRTEFYPDRREGRDLLSHCKECNREKQRIFRLKHGPRVRTKEKTIYADRRWNSHLKRKYRIDVNEYKRLLSQQDGACAICKTDAPGGGTTRFHVDHDHATGAVRGLLCTRCNQMIGYGLDNPDILESGAAYLRRSAICAPVAEAFIKAHLDASCLQTSL